MNYQFRVTFPDGSTITVVSGSPITAAEAVKRAMTVKNVPGAKAVPK